MGPRRADKLLLSLDDSAERARQLVAREGFTLGRTQPTVAFDLATTSLEAGFGSEEGIRKAVVNQQVLWVVDEIYALRVKKLRTSFRPSNHDSLQQRDLLSQRLECEGMTSLVYLTAGVRYSDRTGLPVDYVVVKHYSARRRHIVEWVVDLRELAAGGLAPSAPIIPVSPMAPLAPPAAVSSRRKRGDRREVNDE